MCVLDNYICVFIVMVLVWSSCVNVIIELMKFEEISDMILLNCIYKNNDVICCVYLIVVVDREVCCFVFCV